jgi:ribulose-phosphate 3-epimerase
MPLRPILVAPSILAADFAVLGEEIAAIEAGGADAVHIDVLDGHFAPNISFGPMVMESVRKVTALPFDTHLMISPADPFLEAHAKAGADRLTIHVEAGSHGYRSLQAIRALGKRAGIALNPGTPASAVEPFLGLVDLVLVMTVSPGFGGQAFIADMLPKIAEMREMIGKRPIELQVDGGITVETAPLVAKAGATMLVAGSAIFKGARSGYGAHIAAIRQAAEAARG